MIVASIYSIEDQFQISTPFFYRDYVRTLVLAVASHIQRYYIFVTPGVNHDELFPELPRNVRIVDMDKMFVCVSRQRIDIWHDFGYGNHRALDQLKNLTGGKFRSTIDFRMERFLHYADSGRPDWGSFDGIVYPTEHARKLHVEMLQLPSTGVQSTVIPPNMDFKFLNPLLKEDSRRLLGLPQDEKIILCVSDFSPRHGTDLLPILRAFELDVSKRSNVRLVISGRDALDNIARLQNGPDQKIDSSRITLLGNPDRLSLAMLFAAADIYLHLPDSPFKDSPWLLLYAMGHKLAIIAAKWPSAEALLDAETSGVLVPFYSHQGISSYVKEILGKESYELGALISSQTTGFDVETLAARMERIINEPVYQKNLGACAFERGMLKNQSDDAGCGYVAFWEGLKRKPESDGAPHGSRNFQVFKTECRYLDAAPEFNEAAVLEITEAGRAALGGLKLRFYEETAQVIFPAVVMGILKQVKRPTKIREVLESGSQAQSGTSRDVLRAGIMYHLLFAIKRGLIRWKLPGESNEPIY